MVKGGDFKIQRQAGKEELTLGELAAFYFDQYAKDRCNTASDMERNFKRWFAQEISLRLSQLDNAYIQLCINRLAADGHYYRANRALDLTSAIFGWGLGKNICKLTPRSR